MVLSFCFFLFLFFFALFGVVLENLAVKVLSGKQVNLSWDTPPVTAPVDGYKIYVNSADDFKTEVGTLDVSVHDQLPVSIRNLTSGGTYDARLYTVYNGLQAPQASTIRFTTKPNTPGRFIVWYRNETTLLVLWQPPYPSGIFDKYKVSINPPDAVQSILFVKKESEPPGPAQTSFDGLVPGRTYNITVQTVSNDQISEPTESQYRTVPLPPSNVSFDRATISSGSFDIVWDPPEDSTDFDRFQIGLSVSANESQPKTFSMNKDEPRTLHVDGAGAGGHIEPGETYEVSVKTVSGNVPSLPISANITTRPKEVMELKSDPGKFGSDIYLTWKPDN